MQGTNNRFIFIIFFLFVSCSVLGQAAHKKILREADYSLWSTMEIKGSSAGGSWVCYNLSYESGNDTLVIRNKTANKVYSFPKGNEGSFGNYRWFACSLPDNKISIVDLANGNRKEVIDVKKFEFSSDGNTLAVLQNNNILSIRYFGKPFASIEHVSDFVLNPDKTGMVYTIGKEKTSLHYCPFDGKPEHFRMILNEAAISLEDITWNKNGNAFAFRKKYTDESPPEQNSNLSLYQLKADKLLSLNFAAYQTKNAVVQHEVIVPRSIVVSDNGERVFFYTKLNNDAIAKPVVQIWNGSDAWTYRQSEINRKHVNSHCYVWQVKSDEIKQLTNDEESYMVLSGDQNFAVTFSPMGKQPQFSNGNKFTCNVINLVERNEIESVRKGVFTADEITPSFGGKYVLYLTDEKWFLYNLREETHSSLSDSFPIKFPNESNDRGGIKPDFQIAGWTSGDNELLIYDEFDIWSINLQSFKAERITKGREVNVIYRIVLPSGRTNKNANFDGFTYPQINLNKGIYLSLKGKLNKKTGYAWWKGSEKAIVFDNKTFDELCFKPGDKTIYFTREDFNLPPELLAYNAVTGKETTVFKSNPQHAAYLWGKSELIAYNDGTDNDLHGALFYPANYEPGKKYPMVVWIYERLSDQLHIYVNPSLHNGGAVNISNLTSQGYFVLYPDIKYRADNVGISATQCIVNATKAVIDKGFVYRDKIGLAGHSFGGYESAFIATQTDLFATIVVGAGVSNLLSSYLSIGWNNGRPEIWRYEHDQWRMSSSLFENMDAYLQNSPIVHTHKVMAPILIWTGEQDKQVNYYQSVEFYNALRRLGKKEVMLIYPNNRHRLTEAVSEEDFERRLNQWFDTFLKNLPPAEWIKNEMN